MTKPTTWGHWTNPVLYMSRATAREVWQLAYGTEPDLKGDLRYGQSQIPVLFDDRMELGVARLEEHPSESTSGDQDSLEPSPAELGDTITVAPGEWTPIDDYGTEIYAYGDQPVTLVVKQRGAGA